MINWVQDVSSYAHTQRLCNRGMREHKFNPVTFCTCLIQVLPKISLVVKMALASLHFCGPFLKFLWFWNNSVFKPAMNCFLGCILVLWCSVTILH